VNAITFGEYVDVIYVTLEFQFGMVVLETVKTGYQPHKASSET
jgi:hypothetical protein